MSEACRKAFTQRLLEQARHDARIMALCTDSRGSVTLNDFAKELPEQFVEVGIAEQNSVGIAAGLANAGFKPFVTGPASFLSARSAEQVKVDAGYSHANVKIIGVSGGVSYGALGATHHAVQDIAFMCAVPGLGVELPCDGYQTRQMTDYLVSHEGPVYVRMGRGAVPDVYGPDGITGLSPDYAFGRATRAVVRENARVLVVAAGEMVYEGCRLEKMLAGEGIAASVLDMHTLSPFDAEAVVQGAGTCELVVSIEEHCVNGGLGSLVASVLSEQLPRRMLRFALPNESLVTGTSAEVFRHYGLTAEKMLPRVLGALAANREGV